MMLEPTEHPERTEDDDFARGEDDPKAYPEDQRHRRFSEGEETLPESDTELDADRGRFSEGQEGLPEQDLEKHIERDFAEGQERTPPSRRDE